MVARRDYGERMARVEARLDDLAVNVTRVEQKSDENAIRIEKKIDGLYEAISDQAKTNDKKYATKLTEKLVYGLVGTLMGLIIVAIFKLILTHGVM
jgi:hypothetical protein